MLEKLPNKELTIARLVRNTSFPDLYHKLITDDDLSNQEIVKILSIAVILINQSGQSLKNLGYRIILAYGNRYDDYKPLYEIASNTGLTPVSHLIKKVVLNDDTTAYKDSFIGTITDCYIEAFKKDGIFQTEQQYVLGKFFKKKEQETVVVVAPTSYGKSELIISSLKECEGKSTCIIVPTKSLLAQTKKRILDADIEWVDRIISHPEMHIEGALHSVYVLTQERLTRLLNQDAKLAFDVLFVDEAHNLLDDDSRNTTLASVICILKYRNPETAIKYLTPFLKDVDNLKMRVINFGSSSYAIQEYIKSERFFIADYREDGGSFRYYDQFTNQFINSASNGAMNELEYVNSFSVSKNIIFFNKPRDAEGFALRLADTLDDVDDADINRALTEIGAGIDERYKLLRCLRKGVVYHHGSMTDSIRNYVEYLYRNCDAVKYLVSNSTLLEGVNLPIERLFMLDYSKGLKKLSPSQFKNLVGRVSRFGDVFGGAERSSL
ncbi:DEAD/DEAH box helicase, partial [Verrucomicrobiota bacterium]